MPLRAILVMERCTGFILEVTWSKNQHQPPSHGSLHRDKAWVVPCLYPESCSFSISWFSLSPSTPCHCVGHRHHITLPSAQSPPSLCFLSLQHPELQHSPTPNTCPVYWDPCTKQAKVRIKIPVPYIIGKKGKTKRSSYDRIVNTLIY